MLDEQAEKLEKIDDWQDSAEKKLKQVKERMDELGPEVGSHSPCRVFHGAHTRGFATLASTQAIVVFVLV